LIAYYNVSICHFALEPFCSKESYERIVHGKLRFESGLISFASQYNEIEF